MVHSKGYPTRKLMEFQGVSMASASALPAIRISGRGYI